MAETPNHGYNVPDAGTQNWHEPLNGNFEAFEVDIELRDVGAPGANGYDPTDGAKYLDTTAGEVYLADGSSWSQEFSFGSGGGGISSLTGGDGIDPTDIGDSDTLSILWGDAAGLDSTGTPDEFSNAGDLSSDGSIDALSGGLAPSGKTVENIAGDNLSISNGQLNAAGGSGGATDLTGGDGIDPTDIGDGDTVSVAWGDAADLASGGTVDQLSGAIAGGKTLTNIAGGNLSIDGQGNLNASAGQGGGITGLSGGDGIGPESIDDGNTVFVDAGTYLGFDSSDRLTVSVGSGLGSDGSGNLQASLGNALGFDNSNQIEVATDSITVAGNSVSLGGSTGISHSNLGGVSADQHHARNHDHTESGISTVPNGGLANSSVTVNAGNALQGAGSVSLGGSTTLDVDPAGLAGTGLANDGNSNLEVAWEDAANLGSNGQINDFSAAASLDASGTVDAGRYLTTSGGQVDFAGPAEWANAGSTGTNTVGGSNAVVAGGSNNTASASNATVGGGDSNEASVNSATVAGGVNNTASDGSAVVGGGAGNTANNANATVAGGIGNTAGAQDATVGGGNSNTASATSGTAAGGRNNDVQGEYGTIAGGGPSDPANNPGTTNNAVFDNYGTIGGGGNNQAGSNDGTANAEFATVSGGFDNSASALNATIGGGGGNSASNTGATVGGGNINEASANYATVGGGFDNTASGFQATVPGGGINEASESNAFAAGRKAKARASGAFVWGDSSSTAVESTTPNEVVFQAGGGVTLWSDSGFNNGVELNSGAGSWNSLSARASKTNVEPIDPRDVLAGVEKMSVSTWEYETNEGVTHMGPMAGQFHETFGLGDDPERISTVDADGVALAAIQGLSAELDERDERIDDLEATVDQQREELDDTRDSVAEREEHIADLEAENEQLRDANERLREQNAELEARLAAIEDHLELDSGGTTQGVADD